MCPLSLDDPQDFGKLSVLIKGFSSDTRLALLLGFHYEYTANEVADFLDMTRGGLQNNIEKMIEADLVYRPDEEDQPTYRLTPIGKVIAKFFDHRGTTLLGALERIEEGEDRILREIEAEIEGQGDSMLGEALSERDIERLVNTQKWDRFGKSVKSILQETTYFSRSGDDESLRETPSVPDELEEEETAYLSVKIKEDVGEVQGADNEVYELSEGDWVRLPEADARNLMEEDAAVHISDILEEEGTQELGSIEDESTVETFAERKKVTSSDLEHLKKREQESESLQPLNDGFYGDVDEYINRLKENLEQAAANSELSEFKQTMETLENIEELVGEIYSLRRDKIIKASLSDLDSDAVNLHNATPKEREIFEGITESVDEDSVSTPPTSYNALLVE